MVSTLVIALDSNHFQSHIKRMQVILNEYLLKLNNVKLPQIVWTIQDLTASCCWLDEQAISRTCQYSVWKQWRAKSKFFTIPMFEPMCMLSSTCSYNFGILCDFIIPFKSFQFVNEFYVASKIERFASNHLILAFTCFLLFLWITYFDSIARSNHIFNAIASIPIKANSTKIKVNDWMALIHNPNKACDWKVENYAMT